MERKTRFQRSFTPHIKFWSKITLPGAIFWTIGYFLIKTRGNSWEYFFDSNFYLVLLSFLAISSVGNYYIFYKPNLGQNKKNEF